MTNRKPYPILSALKREGDTFTLGALRMWMYGYHEGPPQVAANDNDPTTRPTEMETYRYEFDAETLIAAVEDDEKNRGDPEYKPIYSAKLHEEIRKPQIRRTRKQMPPPADVDAEDETARHIDTKLMRSWLGADAEILDMAIGPFTYIDVGRQIGAEGSGKTIYRAGRQEVKDVARIFRDEAA